MKHVFGNLLEVDYYDLFAGAELNRLRRINMTPGFSDCSLCKSCSTTYDYEVGKDARWTASGDPIASRDAQIAEYRYHLDRMEASPWWRLGMAVTDLFRGRSSWNRS